MHRKKSSSESLLTLLNAGIDRQSRSAKRVERAHTTQVETIEDKIQTFDTSMDDLIRQQIEVMGSRKPKKIKEKTKHKERPSEEIETGSEPKHKNKKKKLTDTSEQDRIDDLIRQQVELISSKKPNKRRKSKHKECPPEEIEIRRELKLKKRKNKHTNTSKRDLNEHLVREQPEVISSKELDRRKRNGNHKEFPSEEIETGSEPTLQKKKRTNTGKRDLNDNLMKQQLEVISSKEANRRKKPGKHKELPPEEIETRSEPKLKKKQKKHTDTSKPDLIDDLIRQQLELIRSKEPNGRQKKDKHKELPLEEIDTGSEHKHKKKNNKCTDKSEDDVNNVELKITHYNDDTEKNKRDRSMNSSDIIAGLTVEDETVRKKKESNRKEIPLEEIEVSLGSQIRSEPNDKKRKKKLTDIGERDHSRIMHEKDHDKSGNIKKRKPNISMTSSDLNGKLPAVGDETKKEKKKKKLDLEDTTKILRDINVLIPFEVPQTHLIETRISSKPTEQQKEQFKALNVNMISRTYTNVENAAIKANWEEFCRTHHLPNKPELFMNLTTQAALPPSQRINFVRFLGRGLEHRMLFSIYTRFKVLFRTYKKGKFTSEEDTIIRDIMKQSNVANKFAMLATTLGRSEKSIKAHYRLLHNDKVTWSIELIKDVIRNLMKVLGKEVLDELKTAAIERPHWEELEKLMGISVQKLQLKWMEYIYPRLFGGNYSNLIKVQRKLIDILYDNSMYDRKEINWNELALDFDGISANRLYKVFVELMDWYVPKAKQKNFRDAVDYLKNDYLVGLQKPALI